MADEIRFDIEYDSNSIFQNNKGAVTADVYWKFGEECFPSVKWSDFVIVISTWWLNGCIQIKSGSRLVQFDFMDGPFYFEARLISDAKISLTFHDENKPQTTGPYFIGKEHFFNILISHAIKVAESCNHFQNRDLSQLLFALNKISTT